MYFLGEKDTPLIYFWSENDTHSYTWRHEKYTPFQPHVCTYLYNGSNPPPWRVSTETSNRPAFQVATANLQASDDFIYLFIYFLTVETNGGI